MFPLAGGNDYSINKKLSWQITQKHYQRDAIQGPHSIILQTEEVLTFTFSRANVCGQRCLPKMEWNAIYAEWQAQK